MPRYELGEELGSGTLGRVVALRDRDTGEELAGKILHPSHRADATALARFRGEARVLATIAHSNLVAVRGLASIDGEEVLVMERITGPSLAHAIAAGAPVDESRAAAIGRGIADGLSAAHRAGLVHRDLKPQNVLLAGGDAPKIVDFGLARATSLASVDEGALALVGTPDTMPPEAIDPLAVDPRSDLYSLGCILYEMIAGEPPYAGATAVAILEAHRSAPVPELPGPGVSDGYRALVTALLAKSPADRPQSAAAVSAALRDLGRPARQGEAALEAAGECARCGEPLVAGVAVCFGCAEPQPTLATGGYSVIVTGPGPITHKLDTELRQRLLEWLRANPALRLDPEPLARGVPRLPFAVVTGVARTTAEELASALGSLGLEVEAVRGGRFSLHEMRVKAWSLSGRALAVIACSSAGMIAFFSAGTFAPMVATGLTAAGTAGWVLAGRRVTRTAAAGEAPPAALAGALERVAGVVPAIRAARHRDGLRAVAQRALGLSRALPAGERAEVAEDLARLVDLAVVAASRMDELEGGLAGGELASGETDARARLRERDAYSARLLETTALLDALRAGAATARTARRAGDGALADIRDQVEALEEVKSL